MTVTISRLGDDVCRPAHLAPCFVHCRLQPLEVLGATLCRRQFVCRERLSQQTAASICASPHYVKRQRQNYKDKIITSALNWKVKCHISLYSINLFMKCQTVIQLRCIVLYTYSCYCHISSFSGKFFRLGSSVLEIALMTYSSICGASMMPAYQSFQSPPIPDFVQQTWSDSGVKLTAGACEKLI